MLIGICSRVKAINENHLFKIKKGSVQTHTPLFLNFGNNRALPPCIGRFENKAATCRACSLRTC